MYCESILVLMYYIKGKHRFEIHASMTVYMFQATNTETQTKVADSELLLVMDAKVEMTIDDRKIEIVFNSACV